MVDCEGVRRHLDAYLDGGLEARAVDGIERHLEVCAACSAQIARARSVEGALRGLYAEEPLPGGLAARIRASSARESSDPSSAPRGRSRGTRTPRWLARAALLLVVAGTIALLAPRLDRPADEQRLSTVVVSEFNTFVISRRAIDAPLTDPVALRDWFVDKVDFVPPPPPRAEGVVRLVGGRLCNILDRRVISYMYRGDEGLVSPVRHPEPTGGGRR